MATNPNAAWAALLLGNRQVAAPAVDPKDLAAIVPPGLPADFLEAATQWLASRAELAQAFGAPAWFFHRKQPRRTPPPYAVLMHLDEVPTWESGDDDGNTGLIDQSQFQVSIYAPLDDVARGLGDLVEGALNDAPLLFARGSLLKIRRSSRRSDLDPGRGPGGVDVWQRVLLFDVDIARAATPNS